jgi:imidazole glycerol-phosphate synthase subunit HisH
LIGIINYGVGNIRSIQNMLDHLGIFSEIVSQPRNLAKYERCILPGVGSFGFAMKNIKKASWDVALEDFHAYDKPILGVCLGHQLLGSGSEESGGINGLEIIDGRVIALRAYDKIKCPNNGWFTIHNNIPNPVLHNEKDRFYFNHSFAYAEDTKSKIAVLNIRKDIVVAVSKKNVYGVQFHPEKSHEFGMRLFKSFNSIEIQ